MDGHFFGKGEQERAEVQAHVRFAKRKDGLRLRDGEHQKLVNESNKLAIEREKIKLEKKGVCVK